MNWVSFQVQCMSAKVRWMIDLDGIYIKNKVTSGKIPARVPTKSPAVGSALHRRMWGT